jgi:hypothetical protein
MNTLDDAWRWYELVSRQATLARRLASRYWAELPWDGAIGRDTFFQDLDRDRVVQGAQEVMADLDDLAVMLLFSVFEANVREAVLAAVDHEVGLIQHPALRHAAEDARDWIAEGSFFRVLEPYKAEGHADLIEQVNQVRKYRNWVAHGRRGTTPSAVTPIVALDRLKRFLAVIQSTAVP